MMRLITSCCADYSAGAGSSVLASAASDAASSTADAASAAASWAPSTASSTALVASAAASWAASTASFAAPSAISSTPSATFSAPVATLSSVGSMASVAAGFSPHEASANASGIAMVALRIVVFIVCFVSGGHFVLTFGKGLPLSRTEVKGIWPSLPLRLRASGI